jgi:hypothetical protein
VMHAIDDEAAQRHRHGLWPTTRIVGLLGLALLVAAIGTTAWLLTRGSGTGGADPAIDALAHTYFATTLLATEFDGPLPDDWRTVGALPVDASRGFRLAPRQDATRAQASATTTMTTLPTALIGNGGGAYWTRPLPTDKPVELTAAVRVPRGDDDATVAQLFVTDDPNFTDDRGTSGHELVWLLQDGQSRMVLPGGRMESQRSSTPGTPNRRPPTIALRVAIDRDVAIVEENGHPLWSGPHGLSPGKPRCVGLRFLRAGATPAGKAEQTPVFTSLKVQTP